MPTFPVITSFTREGVDNGQKIKLPQSINNNNMPLISPMKYYKKLETEIIESFDDQSLKI